MAKRDGRGRNLCGMLGGMIGVALLCGGCGLGPTSSVDLGRSAMPNGAGSTPDLNGCNFDFPAPQAFNTIDGRSIAAHAGIADASSVVNIREFFPEMITNSVTILYDTSASDCTMADLSKSQPMYTMGPESDGTRYSDYIPAQSSGTHVCWRVATDACGTRLTSPAAGLSAFDYTTR